MDGASALVFGAEFNVVVVDTGGVETDGTTGKIGGWLIRGGYEGATAGEDVDEGINGTNESRDCNIAK